MHNQKKDNNQFKTKTKTKQNNQNCQKIKLYGNLTTKELKKHSSRFIGGVEMGSQGREMGGKAAAGRPGYPAFTGG